MAATRTQGITIDTDGNFTINKEYRGIRLFFRLAKLGQDQAEQRLQTEIDRVDRELERKAHAMVGVKLDMLLCCLCCALVPM